MSYPDEIQPSFHEQRGKEKQEGGVEMKTKPQEQEPKDQAHHKSIEEALCPTIPRTSNTDRPSLMINVSGQ
jgi:hypothetical protein